MKSKGKQVVEKGNDHQTRRSQSISWIFYYVILPIVATAIFAALALQILGYNVIGTIGSRIGQMEGSHLLNSHGKAVATPSSAATVASVQLAQKEIIIKKLDSQVATMKQQLTQSDQRFASTEANLKQLQVELKKMQNAATSASKEAVVYANMSSQQAAAILMQLSTYQQVLILKNMSAADQASILAVIPPKQAAKLLQAGA